MKTIEEIQAIIKEKLPEGLIVPAHTDQGHFYKHVPTGATFASVTTKMQGVVDNTHLKIWSAKLAVENMANQLSADKSYFEDTNRMEELKKASVMVHRDTFEDAGGIGTVGHKAVEEYNDEWMETGNQPTETEKFIAGKDYREKAILNSALEFYRDFSYLPIASELLVCNLKDSYAGTLDCLGAIIIPEKRCTTENGVHAFWRTSSSDWTKNECVHCKLKGKYQLALIDYKTSNSIKKKPTYCAQVSAYAEAFRLMTGIKIPLLIIVRLDKHQAKYEVIKIKDPKECYKNFKLMQDLSPWLNPNLEHAEPIIKKEIIQL